MNYTAYVVFTPKVTGEFESAFKNISKEVAHTVAGINYVGAEEIDLDEATSIIKARLSELSTSVEVLNDFQHIQVVYPWAGKNAIIRIDLITIEQ